MSKSIVRPQHPITVIADQETVSIANEIPGLHDCTKVTNAAFRPSRERNDNQ